MDYTPAVFTRERPCSKVELHNAFFNGRTYADCPRVVYQSIAGVNSSRYLIAKGYVIPRLIKGVDVYCITDTGRHWLHKGILRHLALHPEDISQCKHLPPGFAPKGVRRGSKSPQKAAQKPALRPVLRRTRG